MNVHLIGLMSKTVVPVKINYKNTINVSPIKYLKPTVAVQKVKIRSDSECSGYTSTKQKLPFIRQIKLKFSLSTS